MDADATDHHVVDLDGDGTEDSVLFDTNGNGTIDGQYSVGADGVGHLLLDANEDGLADYADAYYPQAAAAAPVFDATAVPLSGDTQALMQSINTSMGHAGTNFHEALDPGSQSPADLAAAQQHTSNLAGNLGWMQGQVTADSMHQDAVSDQATREATWRQQESDAETAREADLAEYRADWTVWRSEQERGA
jgi:hypothetical protein